MRPPNIQTIAWFSDLRDGGGLILDPPFQRKSFWSQKYRDLFIDTVLNGFPSPPIFLHVEVSDTGSSKYFVVDGKQRLETIFRFMDKEFAVPESYEPEKGKYFDDLDKETKSRFWQYPITVQQVDEVKETMLQTIFDRINRNVAKLRPQELRHAMVDGEFISLCERLAIKLPDGFPNISKSERMRMTDVEYVSNLVMFIDRGSKSVSTAELDELYAEWDDNLPDGNDFESEFLGVLSDIRGLIALDKNDRKLTKSRLRNRPEFYSLFAAILMAQRRGSRIDLATTYQNLIGFIGDVNTLADKASSQDQAVPKIGDAKNNVEMYYAASRSATANPGMRNIRIEILSGLIETQ